MLLKQKVKTKQPYTVIRQTSDEVCCERYVNKTILIHFISVKLLTINQLNIINHSHC